MQPLVVIVHESERSALLAIILVSAPANREVPKLLGFMVGSRFHRLQVHKVGLGKGKKQNHPGVRNVVGSFLFPVLRIAIVRGMNLMKSRGFLLSLKTKLGHARNVSQQPWTTGAPTPFVQGGDTTRLCGATISRPAYNYLLRDLCRGNVALKSGSLVKFYNDDKILYTFVTVI